MTDDGEELVREILAENPPEERGVREEWAEKVGWHEKYDLNQHEVIHETPLPPAQKFSHSKEDSSSLHSNDVNIVNSLPVVDKKDDRSYLPPEKKNIKSMFRPSSVSNAQSIDDERNKEPQDEEHRDDLIVRHHRLRDDLYYRDEHDHPNNDILDQQMPVKDVSTAASDTTTVRSLEEEETLQSSPGILIKGDNTNTDFGVSSGKNTNKMRIRQQRLRGGYQQQSKQHDAHVLPNFSGNAVANKVGDNASESLSTSLIQSDGISMVESGANVQVERSIQEGNLGTDSTVFYAFGNSLKWSIVFIYSLIPLGILGIGYVVRKFCRHRKSRKL